MHGLSAKSHNPSSQGTDPAEGVPVVSGGNPLDLANDLLEMDRRIEGF
jgi:hypothetical protein